MKKLTKQEADSFLEANPDISGFDLLMPDMSGILRGKRIGRDGVAKLYDEGVRVPSSMYLLDTTGEGCDTLPYGNEDGDPDSACFGAAGTMSRIPWAEMPLAQVMATMAEDDGTLWYADPRHLTAKAAQPLRDMDLTPVTAVELEFYLFDSELGPDGRPRIARAKSMPVPQSTIQCYGMEELYEFESFLTDVDAACKAQGIPADAAISEYAPGQYEINLHHVSDPVEACDDAVLLKRTIKAIGRRHGLCASFMAKPREDISGSGMHIHMSLLDGDGNNIFAGDSDPASGLPIGEKLRHAIGGLAKTMPQAMAIFAPNANSYRRFQAETYAPINRAWGANNRTVSLRVPHSDGKSIRVEHRVSGADANPYLAMACILAGIHHGLLNKIDPGPMETGDAYKKGNGGLPMAWGAALDAFHNADVLPEYLGERYCREYETVRRFEQRNFDARISPLEFEWYLRAV